MSKYFESIDQPFAATVDDVRIGKGARIFKSTFNGPAVLERGTRVGPHVTFGGYNGLGENSSIIRSTVGSFTHCGNGVSINPFNHPTNWLSIHDFQFRDDSFGWVEECRNLEREHHERPEEMFSRVTIGNDTWIGHGAMILGDVTVGDGAIIAAGAIVTKDVPPYAIMVGMPAKVMRYRFPEHIIERLLAVKWWDLPLSELSGLPFRDVERCLDILEERAFFAGSQWTPEQQARFAERQSTPNHPFQFPTGDQ